MKQYNLMKNKNEIFMNNLMKNKNEIFILDKLSFHGRNLI